MQRLLLGGTALDVLAAAAVLLPWWREPGTPVLLPAGPSLALPPEKWAGWEVLGTGRTTLLLVLACAAVVAAAVRRAGIVWRLLVGAAGVAAVVMAVAAAVDRGGAAQGAGIAALAGLAAAGIAVAAGPVRAIPVLAAGAVAVIVAGPAVPGPGVDPAVAAGPFVRLGSLDAATFRSGTLGTRAPRPGLTVLDGAAAVLTDDGVVRLDAGGRAEVLARVPPRDRGRRPGVLGVAGDRVARWVDADVVMVTGLRADDPVSVRVRDVATAGRVGSDGSVWLRAAGDPLATVRRLDLAAYAGAQDLAAVYLPVVTIDAPVGSAPLDVEDLRPVQGGALRTAGGRLDRVTPEPGRVTVTTLAGGLDATCGLTATPRDAFLTDASPPVPDADGGVWFANDHRTLLRLGQDGVLRAVPVPLPGPVTDLVATPDGSVVLALNEPAGPALWRLPDATSALVPLPAAPRGCAADPPPVGPPVGLVPIANTSGDPLGAPLDASGRWASGRAGATGGIVVMTPDGQRLPLGARQDGTLGVVVPDGSGGAWWLEVTGNLATLVHGRPDLPQERLPAVDRPTPEQGLALLPDLGGRPPLIGTATGAYRVTGGVAVQVVAGRIDGGVVRADGRGWVLADGRLVALDDDRVLGSVIDAGAGRTSDVPVVVQLAKAVPPNGLALPRAGLGLDARGRAVVVSDGVVLAVDDGGTVTPVAQDPRLGVPRTVVGGLVEEGDQDTLLRVDLPR